jgi:uncharacterized damage-inducible protein DinB
MPSEIRSILAAMRASRRAIFGALEGTPSEQMGLERTWGGGLPVDVRFYFLRFADHEEEHAVQAARTLAGFDFVQSEAQRILAAAEVTRGELYAALVGLTDADLDLTPAGEWPLRRTLAHVIEVERSYTRNTSHAVECYLLGQPWERPSPVDPEPEAGTLAGFLERLDAAREATLERLARLPDDTMTARTVWAERDVEVRFRLHRYAHHEREHTAHIRKWRGQVDRRPTEAQYLLGLAWRTRGALEASLAGVPDELLDRDPGHGDWPLRRLLDHISWTEEFIKGKIEGAG